MNFITFKHYLLVILDIFANFNQAKSSKKNESLSVSKDSHAAVSLDSDFIPLPRQASKITTIHNKPLILKWCLHIRETKSIFVQKTSLYRIDGNQFQYSSLAAQFYPFVFLRWIIVCQKGAWILIKAWTSLPQDIGLPVRSYKFWFSSQTALLNAPRQGVKNLWWRA